MNLRLSSLLPFAASGTVLLAFGLARWGGLDFLERLEWVTYDQRVRAAATRPAPCAKDLGFVFIDEPTIAAVRQKLLGAPYGLYWPRHVYGRILEQLQTEGAEVVALDVLFADLRPDLGGLLQSDGTYVDGDEFLARQMARGSNVLLAAEAGLVPPELFRTNAARLCDITTDKDADGVLRRVRAFRSYRLWHPEFRTLEADPDYGVNLAQAEIQTNRIILPRSGGLDPIVFPLDADGRFDLEDFYGPNLPEGITRWARPFADQRVWHLGVALAAWRLGADLETAEVDLAGGTIRLSGDGGDRSLPVDAAGRFLVDWSLPINDTRLTQEPAVNLLRRFVARAAGAEPEAGSPWRNKLVVIGSTAVGNDLNDVGATPLAESTFLVSKHWNVANSILTNRFIRRGTALQEILLMLLVSGGVAFLAMAFRPLVGLGLTTLGLGGYVGLALVLFTAHRVWLPMALPLLAAASLYLILTTWRVLFEQTERKRVRSVFAKVVSPNVVSELLGARELALGGARREITVFFADVRGFTELTDQAQQAVADEVARRGLGPEAATELFDRQAKDTLDTVNLYLARVADVVKARSGTLDKYIGDCVMAFWGAPTANSRHALACVQAAMDAQQAIAGINEERKQRNARRSEGEPELPLLALGTGINTGVAVVGLMGSDAHILNYTVFGRDVNVASRLEGVSGRGRIIISEATHQHLRRDDPALAARCLALPPVAVKGIREEVRIYEVPWQEAAAASAAAPPAPSS